MLSECIDRTMRVESALAVRQCLIVIEWVGRCTVSVSLALRGCVVWSTRGGALRAPHSKRVGALWMDRVCERVMTTTPLIPPLPSDPPF